LQNIFGFHVYITNIYVKLSTETYTLSVKIRSAGIPTVNRTQTYWNTRADYRTHSISVEQYSSTAYNIISENRAVL